MRLIENLLRYMFAKSYRNRTWFEKVIAKVKGSVCWGHKQKRNTLLTWLLHFSIIVAIKANEYLMSSLASLQTSAHFSVLTAPAKRSSR